MTYQTMETTATASARVGLSTDRLRRLAAAGEIPGAVRLSGHTGPWRIPADWTPDTPTPPLTGSGGGVTDTTGSPTRLRDLMSRPAVPSPLVRARRVIDTLAVVRSRPAVALTDTLYGIADAAARHTIDRDGRCAACGWTYPCPDRAALDAILDRAAAVIVDGAR